MIRFIYIYIFVFAASPWSLAFAGQSASLDKRCANLIGGLEIISQLGPKKYQVDVWGFLKPRFRAVLITNTTTFEGSGKVFKDVWIAVPQGKPEQTKIQLNNGFDKEFEVLRESAECTDFGKKVAVEQKKRDELQARKEKSSLEAFKKRDRQRINEDRRVEAERQAAIKSGKLEEWEVARRKKEDAEEEEQERIQQAELAPLKEKEDKEADELSAKMKTWFTKTPEERIEICRKHKVREPEGCITSYKEFK